MVTLGQLVTLGQVMEKSVNWPLEHPWWPCLGFLRSKKLLCYWDIKCWDIREDRWERGDVTWLLLRMSPDDLRWLRFPQAPSDAFRCVQVDPDEFRWLQVTPDECRWFQIAPDGIRWLQVTTEGATSLHMPAADARWLHTASDGSRGLQMTRNASKYF